MPGTVHDQSTTQPLHGGTGAPQDAKQPLATTFDPPVRGPILLATIGRGSADACIRAARALAGRLGVGVEVIGVVEPVPAYALGTEIPFVPADIEEAMAAATKTTISEHLASVGGGAESWPLSVFVGDTAGTITRLAREHDSTMIVVGAGRHERRDRLFGGERALKVLRAADRPVFAVAGDFGELPRTVVAGMDFSPASVRAARAALLTLAENGRLVLVHVRPILDLPKVPSARVLLDPSFDALVARWTHSAEDEVAKMFGRLREELRSYAAPGVTIETQARSGEVIGQLLSAADEVGADVVAAGTHGPGVMERFFVGSVAADVLRGAGRSVLLAPAPNAAESARLQVRLRGTADLKKPGDWEAALEAFSDRNSGRRVRLEVDDPEIGAQVEQSGFSLVGAAYDRHDGRVELMIGDPVQPVRHLTRAVARADDVAFYAAPDGREQALRVQHGKGQTLLTFLD